jgi:hypothetical protein
MSKKQAVKCDEELAGIFFVSALYISHIQRHFVAYISESEKLPIGTTRIGCLNFNFIKISNFESLK